MSERGILFTPENYGKVEDGSKPMTRRLRGLEKVNAAPNSWEFLSIIDEQKPRHSRVTVLFKNKHGAEPLVVKCPYGTIGDRLYVKEGLERYNEHGVQYRRDKKPLTLEVPRYGWAWQRDTLSPLHMPKWAARLWLELTDVRVERLCDCSSEDAIAEGADDWAGECALREKRLTKPQLQYAALWDSINGEGSWDLNPWVWVLSFKRMQP